MAKRKVDLTKSQDFKGLIEEFKSESDRSAAIVGSAYLDTKLAEYIASFLVNDSTEVNKLLGIQRDKVGIETPLGAFGARIRAAYCLGLLTRQQYHDLQTIQKIRNEFAHGLHGLSFSDEWMTTQCRGLLLPQQKLSAESHSFHTSKDLFLLTLATLVAEIVAAKFYITAKQRRCVVPQSKDDSRSTSK
jgi:DNA-binding MltR family transcriptional regulator